MTRPAISPDLAESLSEYGWLFPEPASSVCALTWQGEVLWDRRQGAAADQYRIGSITKTFTAALVMRLRDEGLIALDDRIDRHVPDAPYGDATVRGLLSHGSGIAAEPVGPWWERSDGVDWAELVRRNQHAPQVFPPTLRYHYSNLAFGVLGELVARLRNRPWYECVVEELLEPLSMSETTYLPGSGAATGTSVDPDTGTRVAEHVVETGAMAPAGQLWSTVADLARWLDFLAGGRPDVLPAATLREMATVQSGDPDEQHIGGYGLGMRLRWSALSTLRGHTGSMPGFLAAALVEPRSRVGAVILASATTGLFLENRAALLIDEALEDDAFNGHPAVEPASAWLSQEIGALVGPWHHGNTRYQLEPTFAGFKLTLPGSTWHFERIERDRYRGLDGYPAGEELTVHRDPDGRVSHLEVVTFVLTRTPYDPRAPIPGGPPAQLT